MPVVRVEPAGIELDVSDGETVLAAARRVGLAWRSMCGGFAQCRTCYFTSTEPDAFSVVEPLEAAAVKLLAPTLGETLGVVRLACQARVMGNAVVRKVGVRGTSQPA
jgi:ferredoxin, 2Fe-2S